MSYFKVDTGGRHITTISPAIKYIEPGRHFETLLMGYSMCHIATLVKKECYDALGGIDEDMKRGEDYDFLLRLTRQFKGVNVLHKIIRCRSHDGDRGDLAHRHSAAERDLVHLRYDQLIFSKLRNETAIGSYIGKTDSEELSVQDYFNAWFSRATSMGVHGLWKEYMEDIKRCKKFNSDDSWVFSQEHSLILSSCFARYLAIEDGRKIKGFPHIFINETLDVMGKDSATPLARGFYWAIRESRGGKINVWIRVRYLCYILDVFLKKLRMN